MSPSTPFILRPVATTLLMAAIMIVGIVAYRFLPLSALPEVDYPTIQVQTFYPGASPEVMTSSVTSPLEVQFGQMPGLKQMSSTSSAGASVDHPAVQPGPQPRHRRAGSAGGDQRGRQPAARRPAGAADLRQGQPRGRAGADAGAHLKDAAPDQVEDIADTRLAQNISQLPGVGLVSIGGGQRPAVRIRANPPRSRRTGSTSTTCARPSATATPTPRRETSTGRRALHDQRQRPAHGAVGLRQHGVAYRNGAPVRLTDVATVDRGAENTKLAAWVEQDAGGHPQHPAPARRQRHPGGRQIKALLPQLTATPARRRRRRGAHRPHDHHPRLGRRRRVRAGAGRRPGRAGHLRVPAQLPATFIPSLVRAALARRHLAACTCWATA